MGCVVTSFDDTFGTRVLEGLLDEAGADTHVVVKASNGSVERENELIRALVEAGIAGLILLPSTTRFLPPAALELVMREFPVVVLDRSYADVPVSAVFSDNAASAQRATEYLVDLGHTRLGFVASASEVSTTSERHGGYVRAHAVRHVPLDAARQLTDLTSTLPGSVAPRAEVEAEIDRLTGFVRADPATTGYLVTEYNLAVMLREACLRAGLSVPDDVSIVCFDHPTAFSDRELFRFTHVEQDQPELGRRAVQRLLEQIGGGTGTAVAKIEVPSAFVLAESTAPARRLARHPDEG
nr:substrate-binding domain-containing protein [Frondihabitans sucicola]